jgi:hypothetical protein
MIKMALHILSSGQNKSNQTSVIAHTPDDSSGVDFFLKMDYTKSVPVE